MGGIVTAVSDRCLPAAKFREKTAETWSPILSFQPQDSIDLMLAGQLVAFNEAITDAARHLPRGTNDSLRPRARSSLVAMGRLALARVEKPEKRGVQPYRAPAPAEAPAEDRSETRATSKAAIRPAATGDPVPPPNTPALVPATGDGVKPPRPGVAREVLFPVRETA